MALAMSQLHLYACAIHRILKLARVVADLAGSEHIQPSYLANLYKILLNNVLKSLK